MKKRILSAILMAAMLLSMTGCGGNNTIRKTELTNVVTDDYLDTNISEYEDDIHISENITPLDHSDFDYQSSDLGSNEESVYENEDYITFEEAYPDINFSESEPVSDFRGGIAYVRAPVKSDYHNLTFAINTKGEILCECKNDELSKYCIPQYSRDVGNGSMIFDYYLVNMDGKILASPTEDGYDQFAECELAYDRYSQYDNWYKTEDGYLIAIKTEKNLMEIYILLEY